MSKQFSSTLYIVWKVERFKYEKLGIKGVPFGYLEFSRAFREKSGLRVRAVAACPDRSWSLEHGRGSGSVLWTDQPRLFFNRVRVFRYQNRSVCCLLKRAQIIGYRYLPVPIQARRWERFTKPLPMVQTGTVAIVPCHNSCDGSIRIVPTSPSNRFPGVL